VMDAATANDVHSERHRAAGMGVAVDRGDSLAHDIEIGADGGNVREARTRRVVGGRGRQVARDLEVASNCVSLVGGALPVVGEAACTHTYTRGMGNNHSRPSRVALHPAAACRWDDATAGERGDDDTTGARKRTSGEGGGDLIAGLVRGADSRHVRRGGGERRHERTVGARARLGATDTCTH